MIGSKVAASRVKIICMKPNVGVWEVPVIHNTLVTIIIITDSELYVWGIHIHFTLGL